MERTGLAVLMVLSVALMRVGDGHQEATGGRTGASQVVSDHQISQGHSPKEALDLSKTPTTGQSTTLHRTSRGASASRGETVHATGASGEDLVSSSHGRAQRTARHPQTSRVNRRQSSKPGSSSTRRLAG